MEFNLTSYLFMGSVGVIVGLVQLLKLWVSDTRVYPIVAVLIGIAMNIGISAYVGNDLVEGGLMGVIAGLAASGLYSTATTSKT